MKLTSRSLGLAALLVNALTACNPERSPVAADSSVGADAAHSADSADSADSVVAADTASIRSEAQAWFKAIDAKDLEKTLSFYASDAQYLSAGRPAATTADERRKLWIEDFGTPGFSSEEATTQIEVARSRDLAYQRGTYVATMQNERGQMTKSTGKFVVVWKKQSDGRWKAIIDIDNADH
jgi:ketosteroid isomerase-like protein